MIKNRKVILCSMFFAFYVIFNCFFLISVKAGEANSNNTLISPSYVNMGRITNNSISTTAFITNDGEASNYIAKVDGIRAEFVSFEPQSFELGKGERKQVKININNSDKLLPGPYDLSITFSRKIQNSNNGTSSVYTSTSNSLRLQLIKEGFSVAAVNVKDINKPNIGEFNIVFGNYIDKEQILNTNVSIMSKEDNKEVVNYNENIKMQPYPNNRFYGTMKINWDTKDAEMGDYVFKYKGTTSDGKVLEGEKDFAVGEMKGELEGVTVKDTFQGSSVKIFAKVKNTGNLNLPVTFDISIKNSNGEEVFKDSKQENVDKSEEKTLESQWDTTNSKVGEYTVYYTVKMGEQTQSDIIHFKVLGSYLLHIIIVSIVIILFITFVIIAKRKKKISESEREEE